MVLGLGSRDTQIRRSIETKQQLKCIALYFLHFFKLFKFLFVSPDTKPFSIIRSFFILGLYFIIIIFFSFSFTLLKHLVYHFTVACRCPDLFDQFCFSYFFPYKYQVLFFYDLRSSDSVPRFLRST